MSTPTNIDVLQLFIQAAYEVADRRLTGLTRDTRIASLGMDSIAVMELVSFFEEKLSLRIPDEELARMRTVGDLRDTIAKLVPQGTTVTA
jgi:acyl carrier protein